MAAQCLGSSLGLPMIHVRTATEVLSPWVGGSEKLVRSLFAKARYAAPCILFLDEIDSIASNRELVGGSSGVMSRVLSTLLNELDGIGSSSRNNKVLVVACSNRREALDAALLRPGRLEEHVFMSRPEKPSVEAILSICLSKTPHDESFMDELAERLLAKQATGADIYGLCREAVINALRKSKDTVHREDFEFGLTSWYESRSTESYSSE